MSWWWGLLRRYPLLIFGIAGAGCWTLGHSLEAGLVVGVGGLLWLWLRQRPIPRVIPTPPATSRPSRADVESYLAQLQQELADLEQEVGTAQLDLQQAWQGLRQALEVPLSVAWAGALTAPPPIDTAIPVTDPHPAWVLYGVQDQLSASQLDALTRYQQQDQPVQVVWLNAPWQPPSLRHQVEAQLRQIGYTAPLLTITLQPAVVLVRRLHPDGTWEESWEIPSPVLEELVRWVDQRRQEPHWQYRAVLRRGQALQAQVAQRRQAHRAQRARQIIQRYRLWAALTAGVSPLPLLDLWGTGALNAQMLVDLAQVYRRPLTFAQAKDLVLALGTVLVQMGLVEWVTQAVGAWLKSQVVTYGFGSAVQALSAAYITQVAGETFVEALQTPARELTPGLWQSLRTRVEAIDLDPLWQQLLSRWRSSSVSGKAPVFG